MVLCSQRSNDFEKCALNKDLSDLLLAASPEKMTMLIESVYGMDDTVDNRIESLLLQDNPKELAKLIKKRIQSLKRGSRHIDYRESFAFSLLIEAIVADITPLVEVAPKIACEVLNKFVETHSKVFERCDDSSGVVGECYREASALWLKSAALWRAQDDKCQLDWPSEVVTRHYGNEYGIWDGVISNSLGLLTHDELKQLAWRFEGEAKRAMQENTQNRFSFAASRSLLGLASVAQALGDIVMYERSTLIMSPKPNDLQKHSLAKFCLQQNDGERALTWLNRPFEVSFRGEGIRLLDEAYVLLGRTPELIELRTEVYERTPNLLNMESLLSILPEKQQDGVRSAALDNAYQSDDFYTSISTLIDLNAMALAAQKVVEQSDKVGATFYGVLVVWAKQFEQSECALAATVCYRYLLDDILQSARSKAYQHGARYYQALARLEEQIQGYEGLIDHGAYQAIIDEKHKRKSSFWTWVSKYKQA